MANNITQRIALEGGKEVQAQLQAIGSTGQQAFNNIKSASDKLNVSSSIGAVEAAAAKAGVSFNTMAAQVQKASAGVGAATAAAASGATSFASGAARASAAAAEVGGAATVASGALRSMSQSLRAVGKIGGGSEIGQLGKALSLVGRNFAALAPLAAVAGLERLASSGAHAAETLQNTAFAARTTTEEFQSIEGAGIAAGVGSESMGKAIGNLNSEFQKTATAETEFAKRIADAKDGLANAQAGADNARAAFSRIGEEARKSAQKFADGNTHISRSTEDLASAERLLALDRAKFASQDFKSSEERERATIALADRERQLERQKQDLASQSLKLIQDQQAEQRKLAEEYRRAQADMDKANREVEKQEKALRDARREADLNGTALQKLGISAKDSAGNVKSGNAAMLEFADAFARFGSESKKNAIAIEIFGDSARRMIPILNGGAAAFKKFEEEGTRLVPPLTAIQKKIGDDFVAASSKFVEVVSDIKNKTALAIAPAFIDAINTLTEGFVAARPALVAFIEQVGGALKPVMDGLANIIVNVVGPAVKGLASLFQLVADGINKLFGTNLTGFDVFAAAITAVAIAFGGLTTAIIATTAAVSFVVGKFPEVATAAQTAIDATKSFFQALWNRIVELFTPLGDFFNGIAIAVSNAWSTSVEFVKGIFSDAYNFITGLWDKLVSRAKAVGAAIAGAFKGAAPGAANGGAVVAAAGGGYIRGPGTATSDSIRAWLSDGEFVQRAKAVRKYGVDFMAALNNMSLPAGAVRSLMSGFNAGGLVEAMNASLTPRMAFASGGLVAAPAAGGGGRPLVLNLPGGGVVNATTDESGANALLRFASAKALRSAGRKPNWYQG